MYLVANVKSDSTPELYPRFLLDGIVSKSIPVTTQNLEVLEFKSDTLHLVILPIENPQDLTEELFPADE